jgi:hypothetical protein
MVFLLVESAQAQTSGVYFNNETVPNTVSAFKVDGSGALQPVPGSPFPTGGTGGRTAMADDFSNATIQVKNNLLFVCNSFSGTVSVFTIHPNGSLTAVAGSPFATGGRYPIAVVTNPRGTRLFVNNHDTNNLSVFTIARNGVLQAISGSPFNLQPLRQPTGLAINSTGTMLLIGGENAMSVYRIGSDGAPEAVGELVETGFNTQALALTADDRFVYAAGLASRGGLASWTVSADGQLTPVAGSPFPAPSSSGFLGLAVNPQSTLLAATAPGAPSVSLYQVESSGQVSVAVGSPFSTNGTELKSIRVDASGKFVFAADAMSHAVHVLQINTVAKTLTEITASPFDLGNQRARPSGIGVK